MNSGKRQLLPLTGMRCFLALWVVIYHQIPPGDDLAIAWMPHAPDALACLLRTGYVAVTIFFVLSGFVLSYNYDLDHAWSGRTLTRFAVARFSRIYPAYCLGLLLMLPLMTYRLLRDFSLPVFGRETVTAVLNWTLLQAWLPQTALTWNYPAWSLSDEAFFYACLPFVGLLLWRLSRPKSLLIAGLSIWFLSVAAPLWAVALPVLGFGDLPATTHSLPSYAEFTANLVRYNPLLRVPEFCMGILLGRLYHLLHTSRPHWFGRGYWFYIPGILATLLVLSQADAIPYPLIHNGLLLPLYLCVLLGLALDGGVLARVLSSSTLVLLGNASYSMYILHAPVASWMSLFSKKVLGHQPGGLPWVGIYALLVVLLSCFVFKAIEEPLHRILKKRLGAWTDRWTSPQPVRQLV